MPADITSLTEGWLELESDPGLFTLLLEDFGVNGVQVEEIYDLKKPIKETVYGFIFLFRWIEERRARRKLAESTDIYQRDENVVNSIFFAHQIVPNSCATHALLSILLNCDSSILLGSTLSRLKNHTADMTPENKGYAIGNTPELAFAHNSHAMPQARRRLERNAGVSTSARIGIPTQRGTCEAFHFVSFVPINGHLFELDGLKPFPMDHGTWEPTEDWTDKFRRVITNRIDISNGEQDIRFNLMAVVPDRRLALSHKLKTLRRNKEIVAYTLEKLVNGTNGEMLAKEEEEQEQVPDRCEPADNGEMNHDISSFNLHQQALTDPSPPELSTLNISPNNLSEELANLASLTNSSDNTLENPTPAVDMSSDPATNSCDNQFDPPRHKDDAIDLSIESSLYPESEVYLTMQPEDHNPACNPIVKSENHKASSSASGNFSAATPTNLFESSAASSNINLCMLLAGLENNIAATQQLLDDENDKRHRYKVDDCRRTHNYDEFITTFLTMLAQEGALSELVQQHLRAKGKLGMLQRQSKSKLLIKKAPTGTNGSAPATNGSANERSPKAVKRRRTGGGRKKARKKK